jgi:hypothetical protein
VVSKHGVPVSIIFDRDAGITQNSWRAFQQALGTQSTTLHLQTDEQEKECYKC